MCLASSSRLLTFLFRSTRPYLVAAREWKRAYANRDAIKRGKASTGGLLNIHGTVGFYRVPYTDKSFEPRNTSGFDGEFRYWPFSLSHRHHMRKKELFKSPSFFLKVWFALRCSFVYHIFQISTCLCLIHYFSCSRIWQIFNIFCKIFWCTINHYF